MLAVKDALVRFARAHAALARAEAEQIGGEIAWLAGLAGLALALLLLLGILLPVGGMLFLGEWILGSIGWGLLLGSELLVAGAVAAVLAGLRVAGLGRDLVGALVIGLVMAVVLGPSLPNLLFRVIGEASALAVDPAVRPLVVGLAACALIGGLVGLVVGARAGGGRGAFGGLIAFAILGALAGAFLAIDFGWRVGVALGFAVALIAWPVLMGLRVKEAGIDAEVLKARFMPQRSIDAAKETMEWAKAKVPGMGGE